MNKELLQQALDALEYHAEQTRPIGQTLRAIFALREALSQPSVAVETEMDCWLKTSAELKGVSYEMDVIYERYGKKEHRVEREYLLGPLRLKCREIGERRQALVVESRKVAPPPKSGRPCHDPH